MTTTDEWLTLCLLAIHSTSLSLLLRYAQTVSAGRQYLEGPLLVCIVETVKLLASLSIQLVTSLKEEESFVAGYKKLVESIMLEFSDRRRALLVWAPSIAYAIQNNLYYVAMQRISVIEYQFGMQLRIIWAALASSFFLGQKYSRAQWLSLLLLCFGVVFVQFGDIWEQRSGMSASKLENPTKSLKSLSVGWLAMLVGSALSGATSVLIDWINLHKPHYLPSTNGGRPSIWVKTAQVSFYTLIFSIFLWQISSLAFGASSTTSNSKSIKTSINSSSSFINWLTLSIIIGQSFGGIIVSYVSVSISSLERIFATSLSLVFALIGDRISFPRSQSIVKADVVIVVGVVMVLVGIISFKRDFKSLRQTFTSQFSDRKYHLIA